MKNFKRTNLILGWAVFVIASTVYYLTMEPSVSLWDCGEFIATSYKMEVGHPPGAPLFMMLNRFFSIFASDVTKVAAMVNFASVISSGLTIAFLYWTISHLALKFTNFTRDNIPSKESIIVFGSALIGSLAYAFTDTFWFSAVEGEVYAQSSLFTAMVFWAMLKWENEADKAYSSRWLILIAYLMGLSIGVHLLNLLTIPALVMVYYYKNNNARSKFGWWKAFGFSIILLAVVLFVIIPKTIALGAWTDKLFVNVFGMTKNIGFIIFSILTLGLISLGVYYTHKKSKVVLNTILLCLGVMLVGYGTYASVVIRSAANLPMNSGQPDDAHSLMPFLSREQYGDTPLVTGPYYNSPGISVDEKTVFYYDEDNKIYKSRKVQDDNTVKYAPGTTTIFPRMYSPLHEDQYKSWVNIKGKTVKFESNNIIIPTFAENLSYFFKYQLNYMYWRYFLWNFVGRQNDLQGVGGSLKGNWISGIDFIDELYIGSQDNLPSDLKNNKGRNTYFFLPFLLGILGLIYQLSKDRNGFVIVMFLFVMTGIAIILYLNQYPNQPRERDYAFAGSFYAFSIWIGLGTLWVNSMIKKYLKQSTKLSAIISTIICMIVPTILIAQNWDDHDRSGRYIARDVGANYLKSTLPNSILLTYGDNDTFGPWYSQEVEGVRTDVRVCNLSYIASNWYAEQMTYKFNESLPIEFTIPKRVYMENTSLPVVPIVDGYLPIKDVLGFIASESEKKTSIYKQIGLKGDNIEIIPTNKIAIPVNKANALKSGIIKESDLDKVQDTIYIELKKDYLLRSDYLFLDMIGTSDWSRPIYLTQTSFMLPEYGLRDYVQYDGFAYKLVPFKTPAQSLSVGCLDSEYLYNKVMNTDGNGFKYGNIKDPNILIDVFSSNTIMSSQMRNIFARLSIDLAQKGDTIRASEVILKSLEEIPFSHIGHDYFTPITVEALILSGNVDKARELIKSASDYYLEYIDYFSQFERGTRFDFSNELNTTLQSIYFLYDKAKAYGQEDLLVELKPYSELF